MSTNSQYQSSFVIKLPREIRNLIYVELWRSCGLRQHVIWHSDQGNPHFCRWPCTTKYQVEDELQQELEVFRNEASVTLGQEMRNTVYGRRLQSPWINHWACGERAEEAHGLDAINNIVTSGRGCWRRKRLHGHDSPSRDPYIPMLLSCKVM